MTKALPIENPESKIQNGDAEPYAEWQTALDALTAAPGTTLLLGGVDVGKTTFTRLLANRLVAAGHAPAILDADLGQSEIGPPACVGLAFCDAPVLALSDLKPHALAFVGSASPPGYLLEHVAAMRRLADLAANRPLIVDTSGYLRGAGARRLNQTAFDLLSPVHVVALQRRGELEPILAPMRRREGVTTHDVPVAAVIGKKPPAFRTQRRALRFGAYFQEAALHTYAFGEIAIVGTWFGGGVPVAPHLLKYLNESLDAGRKVYHAELCDRELGLLVNQPIPPQSPELALALQELRAQSVSVTVAPRLKHLLLGLESANGKLLGLGLLEALDFRRATLGVLTPVRAPAAAKIVHFGGLRLLSTGAEVGKISPGEL